MSPERAEVLTEVAALVLTAGRPVLIGIDGPDGVGKTWFADELADVLAATGHPVVRASVDDFHHSRAHRHECGRTGATVWSRSFDYRALRRELLDPWRAADGGEDQTAPLFRRRWHDVHSDEYLHDVQEAVPERGVLLVDGIFLHRPELAGAWDLSVWLDAPPEITVSRLAARDGSPDDPEHPDQQRYIQAQRFYREGWDPASQADLVVDARDLSVPVIQRAEDPPGWRREGDDLVREVRVPNAASARHVDDVTGAR